MITGQAIIDFIHNLGLENSPVSRTLNGQDELVFQHRTDSGNGNRTVEYDNFHLNFQSGHYYRVLYSRKLIDAEGNEPKEE